jgi:hypothetical protein
MVFLTIITEDFLKHGGAGLIAGTVFGVCFLVYQRIKGNI